jgi:type IV fimbrial biogenesis protein FimT
MFNLPKRSIGYTLIELMVTITAAGILMSIAVPSYTAVIDNTRLTTYTNELVTALNYARSEAIKRGVQVTVKRKGDVSAHWESGWDVFVDNDPINAFNDNGDDTLCEQGEDCLLRTFDPLLSGYQLTASNNNYADYAAYLPSGLSYAVASVNQFTLCNKSVKVVPQRTIKINTIGRPSVDSANGTCP